MAQNAEAVMARMLNVPEGFQPPKSAIDLQVDRLLGRTPAQGGNEKPAAAATGPKGSTATRSTGD